MFNETEISGTVALHAWHSESLYFRVMGSNYNSSILKSDTHLQSHCNVAMPLIFQFKV